jgi:hypothetical protein
MSSWAGAKPRPRQPRADFSLGWALKDLDLMPAVDRPDAAPVAATIADRSHALVDSGLGNLDVSAARLGLGKDRPTDLANAPSPAPIHRLSSRDAEQVAVTEWADVS